MNAHNEQPDPASPVVKQNLTTQPAAAQLGDRLDRAYAERNALAIAFAKAALAAGWRAGRGYDDDQSKDWAPQWRHVVYVDLPDGRQVSWHMAPAEVELLDRLPQYAGEWNGEFTARDPSWCRFDAPAAAQEAVGWQWRWLDTDNTWSEWVDGGSRKEIDARIARWKADGEDHRMQVRPVFAAPVTAAPAIDPSRLGAAMSAFDAAGGHAVRYAPEWMRKALEAASTPAAPGIDLYPIRYALQYAAAAARENTHSELAEDFDELIRKLDASPKGDEAQQAGAQAIAIVHMDGYRWNGQHWQKDSPKGGSEAPTYTTGHCENHKKPGGCPLHNLQCGYPQCDRRQAGDAEVQP